MAPVFENGISKGAESQGSQRKIADPAPITGRPKDFWNKLLAEYPSAVKGAPKPRITIEKMRRRELAELTHFLSHDSGKLSDADLLEVINKINWCAVKPNNLRTILKASPNRTASIILLEAIDDLDKEHPGPSSGNIMEKCRDKKMPMDGIEKIIEMQLLKEIRAGNMPKAAMLARLKNISEKKIKAAIAGSDIPKYLRIGKAKKYFKDFFNDEEDRITAVFSLGGWLGAIGWTVIATTLLDWAWYWALGAGYLGGAAIGVGLTTAIGGIAAYARARIRAREKWTSMMEKAWQHGPEKIEGEADG